MQNQLVNFTDFVLNTLFLITYGLRIRYTIYNEFLMAPKHSFVKQRHYRYIKNPVKRMPDFLLNHLIVRNDLVNTV